jgi:uncharacterized protein YbcV (DUF1398 family)
MFDIGDKEKLIREILGSVDSVWVQRDNVNTYPNSSNDINELVTRIAAEVAERIAKDVVKEAVTQIITRLYTHNEFERDLGLRD